MLCHLSSNERMAWKKAQNKRKKTWKKTLKCSAKLRWSFTLRFHVNLLSINIKAIYCDECFQKHVFFRALEPWLIARPLVNHISELFELFELLPKVVFLNCLLSGLKILSPFLLTRNFCLWFSRFSHGTGFTWQSYMNSQHSEKALPLSCKY